MAQKELTKGKPLGLIIAFMIPVFLGNIFQQFYNLIDALIVGRVLGIEALGAVGACAPLIFLIISFIFASTQGFAAITAQRFGARDYDNVRKSLCASLILSFFLTIILTSISAPFAHKMLEILNTPDDIINLSSDYLFIMLIGIFTTVFYNVSSNIIRALGDSKTPLYFLIFASFLNIILDIVFVALFHWGIKGAGWATVLSQGISSVLCITFMFLKFPILRTEKKDWFVSKKFLFEHLNLGIPMGFQMSVLTLGMIVLQYVLNGFGSNAVAAFTTAMRIDQTFTQIYPALGATMAVFSAQNFGAGKMSRIKEGAKSGVIIVICASIFSIFVLGFFATPIVSVFMNVPDENIISLAVLYLHTLMIFFVFLGLLMLYRNILQGMGNAIVPLISSLSELIARSLCAIVFAKFFGYIGICIATPAAWVTASIVLYSGYKINLYKNYKKLKN